MNLKKLNLKSIGVVGAVLLVITLLIFGVILFANISICQPCISPEIWEFWKFPGYTVCQSAYVMCQGIEGILYFGFVIITIIMIVGILLLFIAKSFKINLMKWFKLLLPLIFIFGLFIFYFLLVLVDLGMNVVAILIPGLGAAIETLSETVLEMIKASVVIIIVLITAIPSLLKLSEATKK